MSTRPSSRCYATSRVTPLFGDRPCGRRLGRAPQGAQANGQGKICPSTAVPSFLGIKLSHLIGVRFDSGAPPAPSPLRGTSRALLSKTATSLRRFSARARHLAKCGTPLPKLGKTLLKFGTSLPKLGKTLPKFGTSLPTEVTSPSPIHTDTKKELWRSARGAVLPIPPPLPKGTRTPLDSTSPEKAGNQVAPRRREAKYGRSSVRKGRRPSHL